MSKPDVVPMIDHHKYIVFKREEFENRLLGGEGAPDWHSLSIGDAVVIRQQDVFAAAGLYAYANAIHAVLDIADELGSIDEEQAGRLKAIADYFANHAEEASKAQRKLPD